MSARSLFVKDAMECGQSMGLFLNKIPYAQIQSYKRSEDGRFTVGFPKENSATISHEETGWDETLKDVTVKLSKVVTGKIDAVSKLITFDPGCVQITKKVLFSSLEASLTGVGIESETDKTMRVVGKLMGTLGFFVSKEKETVISNDTVLYAKLKWKE